jgi:hypothetical protein
MKADKSFGNEKRSVCCGTSLRHDNNLNSHEFEVFVFDSCWFAVLGIKRWEENSSQYLDNSTSLLVSTIKCYVCDSSSSPQCDDPFSTSINNLKDCEPNEFGSLRETIACMKLKYFDHTSNEWKIQRKCNLQINDPCRSPKIVDDSNIKFCGTCEKDGCNGSLRKNPGSVLTFAAVFIIFLSKSEGFVI